MKLRNRQKAAHVIDDDNEEDVDDPADDSDCDPEWEEPEERLESSASVGLGRKRKSFMPFQMQGEHSKVQKIGDSSSSEDSDSESTNAPKKVTPIITQKHVARRGRPGTIKVELTNTQTSATSTLKTVPNIQRPAATASKSRVITPKPAESKTVVINETMILKDKKGVSTKCSYKVIKHETDGFNPGTSKQTSLAPSPFSNGDFLKDITKKSDSIWQVDGMNLLQKFVPTTNTKTGELLYKSSFTYDGLNKMNETKFQKVSASIVNKIKNETFVRVNEDLNPLDVKAEPADPEPDNQENVVSSSEPLELPPPSLSAPPPLVAVKQESVSGQASNPADIRIPASIPGKLNPSVSAMNQTPGIANYKNTFKEDFTVFLQALISQCLDPTFLQACYRDQDEYFIDKIKTIDDVLEAKKFSLMSLPAFPNNERILYAIHMYPIIEEQQLPAIKMENLNCVVCVEQGVDKLPACSSLCLKLTGEPYERNTLLNVKLLVDIDDDLKVLRVCSSCSKILKLYSKMCHTKYLIYKQCERVVLKMQQMKEQDKMEASEVIINLLNNEPWCETKLLQIIKDWISVDDLKKEN